MHFLVFIPPARLILLNTDAPMMKRQLKTVFPPTAQIQKLTPAKYRYIKVLLETKEN